MKMKNPYALRAAIVCTFALLGPSNLRAAEATGTASATILQPVTITKLDNLDFGKIIAGSSPGEVTLTAQSQFKCGTGLTCLDSPKIARFNISGVPGMSVSIQSDSKITLTSSAGATMPVALQTSTRTMRLGQGASNVLGVGGTLNVGANQAEGVYSGLFTITVNYN